MREKRRGFSSGGRVRIAGRGRGLAGEPRLEAGDRARLQPQAAADAEGEVGEVVMAMAQRVGREAFLRQQRAILERPDSRAMLRSLDRPALIAVGEDDRMTQPEESRRLHALIPHSQLHVFTRCGHLPPLEKPEETSALLREWLLSPH